MRNPREGSEQGGAGGRKLQPRADSAGDPRPPGQSAQNHVLRLDQSSSRLKTRIPACVLPKGQHTQTSYGVKDQAGGRSGQPSPNQGHTPTEAGLLPAGPTRRPTLSCQDRGVTGTSPGPQGMQRTQNGFTPAPPHPEGSQPDPDPALCCGCPPGQGAGGGWPSSSLLRGCRRKTPGSRGHRRQHRVMLGTLVCY